ncbi:MAG TPA: trehalose-6-phosphate synthase [Acidimicrobiia bacterium]|nr:trehalose-6-phosphate synthase [Acidimicrobiia bacterium]
MLVVSHRGPVRFTAHDDGTFSARQGAGGVASALGPPLRDTDDDVAWIAAAMSPDDRAAARAGAVRVDDLDLRLLDLDETEHRLHYDVVSNQVLWFLHHGLFDLVRRPRFDRRFREAWAAYESVNRRFAEAAAETASEGAAVLVQDYQLALVPAYLRSLRADLRIVHFTHTPFCGPNSIRVLPDHAAEALCASLAGSPAGFHTDRWARAFSASAREVLGTATADRAFAASLGPDPDALAAVADSDDARRAGAELAERVGDRLLVLRSDRVEPSKNIVRGFHVFDRVLEQRPDLRGAVVFVALLNDSRETLPEYLAYANEVEQSAQRVNERWGSADWTPVVLDRRDDFAQTIAAFQRYDVLFVNPIKDGLNLVAKEGPLVNRSAGVLCLSREAGAYEELHPAVETVHPFDIEQGADALARALTMTPEQRAPQAERLRALAAARRPRDWFADLVAHAG